ncbi:MAG: hypothetical protein P1R58_01220 [bacterium]|nr:hypothetical protein [bacterium]
MKAKFFSGIVLLTVTAALLSACQPASQAEDQSPAAVSFRKNCQACHRLPNPANKSDEEWPILVQRYGERAKLTPENIALISDWLIANN